MILDELGTLLVFIEYADIQWCLTVLVSFIQIDLACFNEIV